MAETISIGVAAARVVASIGVLFDRIMDSADEYVEALDKLVEPEEKPTDPYVVGARVYDNAYPHKTGKIIQVIERDRVAPIRVALDNGAFRWYNDFALTVLKP